MIRRASENAGQLGETRRRIAAFAKQELRSLDQVAPPTLCARGDAPARSRETMSAADGFAGQLGESVLQRELGGPARDEIQKLPMEPDRARRAQRMATTEGSLRSLRLRGSMAANQLQGAGRLHRENRAVVAAR